MRHARWTLALVVAIGLCGCQYSLTGLSKGNPYEGIESIGVPTVKNDTDRPEIEQRISEALIEELSRRSRYTVKPSVDGADALLNGEILSFRTEPVTFSESGRFDRVEVIITARIQLIRDEPKSMLWSQNHFVFRQQYDVPETATTEFDREIVAVEAIASEFARSIVTSILEDF